MRIMKKGKSFVASERLKQYCLRSFIGILKNKQVHLLPEEVLFLAEQKSVPVYIKNKRISLINLFNLLQSFIVSYYAYRDWRYSAIASPCPIKPQKKRHKEYPSNYYYKFLAIDSFFSKISLGSFSTSKYLYSRYWFGQYSSYKKESNDRFLKLDAFETTYLSSKGVLSLNAYQFLKKRIKDFDNLYAIYSDWRDAGYVVKTGLKFGAHFRVYEQKAKPSRSHKHSLFVLHFFSKPNIPASDWARAIRVAHSVKKSFVFSTNISPKSPKNTKNLYFLYTKKGHGLRTPKNDSPSFLLYPIHEDQNINISFLLHAIEEAEAHGLELLVAIVDRETSVTYYRIRKILLHGSKRDYYEVLWFSK